MNVSVRACVCVVFYYLHEAAAFSFSAHKKACGDAGDLKEQGTEETAETKRVRSQGANESFIKGVNALGC